VAAVKQKAAHRNLRVLLSVGGGGRSDGFIFVSKRSADRKSFVQKLVMLCNEQGLDGIDFDWEGMDFLQNRDMLTAYTQLLIQAKKQLKKHQKLVTMAMHPGQEKYMIDQKLADVVDRIHFMAYDQCSGGGGSCQVDVCTCCTDNSIPHACTHTDGHRHGCAGARGLRIPNVLACP
jgi:GH18 family chitinase